MLRLFGRKVYVLPKKSENGWVPSPPLEEGWVPYTSPEKYPLGVLLEVGVWNCERGSMWTTVGVANSHSADTSTMFVATHYWRMTGIGKMQQEAG